MREDTNSLGIRQPSSPIYEPLFVSLMKARARRNTKQSKQCPNGCGFWFQEVDAGWYGNEHMTCLNCSTIIDPETFFDR